jgi:hypothetical protein
MAETSALLRAVAFAEKHGRVTPATLTAANKLRTLRDETADGETIGGKTLPGEEGE